MRWAVHVAKPSLHRGFGGLWRPGLFVLLLAGLAPLRPAVSAELAGRPLPPNIVVILADDLGYGELGCFGQKVIQTPCIDRMAAQGMRFTDFYAGCTVCAPSRCALMTGLHTGHARIRGNLNVPLAPEDRTVAEVLKKAGYYTGLIGKWGLGEEGSTGVPNRKGFDYFFGYLARSTPITIIPDFLWRNQKKVLLRNEVRPVGKQGGGVASKRVDYADDLFTNGALEFIDQNAGGPSSSTWPTPFRTPTTKPATRGWKCPTTGRMPSRPGRRRQGLGGDDHPAGRLRGPHPDQAQDDGHRRAHHGVLHQR